MMDDLLKGLAAKFAQPGAAQQADPQEAGQLVSQYVQTAPPQEQQATFRDFVQTLSPEQRAALAQAMNEHPDMPVQNVSPHDDDALAQAMQQSSSAVVQQGANQEGMSPLQQIFAPGGALSNPLVKAGLIGLAGVIGSRMLNR